MLNIQIQKKPKVPKQENKKLKALKKHQKDVQKLKKKVLTTLDWCDVKEVTNNEVILQSGNGPQYHVVGVKVAPHDIFLDDDITLTMTINKLRLALNKLPFKIYWAFVTSPVNIDDYKARLYNQQLQEDNLQIANMLSDDYNKATEFETYNNELEFMFLIRNKDVRLLEKQLQDLFRETTQAGMYPKYLNKKDYLNYLAYIFENLLVNSVYFSRGIFHSLVEQYQIIDNSVVINKVEEDEMEYSDVEFTPDDDFKLLERSKMMPTSFSKTRDFMTLGDKFMSAILITELPESYNEGLLCWYLNRKDIKVLMTTEKIDMDIARAIKKDRNDKLDEYYHTTDPTRQTQLKIALDTENAYLDRVIRNNDITLNTTIIMLVTATSREELYQKRIDTIKLLEAEKFKAISCKMMQEQALRIACPILLDGKLPRQIELNYGIPLPSEGIAGLYPFVFETLKDYEGFLFGHELANSGVILFDPYAYKRPQWSNRHDHQRTNGNMIIVGKSGFGKSVALDLTIRNDIKEGCNVVAIDPENKITRLIKKYGGSVVNYGVGNNKINVFDLRPLSTDEDEEDENYDRQKALKEMWDTKNAINFVIGQVNQIFTYLFKEYTDEEASLMGDLIVNAYAQVGIATGVNGEYESFRLLKSSQMPTFSTVLDVLRQYKEIPELTDLLRTILDKLEIKLSRVCGEWAVYLDGHTSLAFESLDEKKVVAFGTKQLQNVSDQLKTALNHIMYNYAWSLCIDNEQWSSFILDEAHVNILQGEIAALTAQFVRRARKYNTSVRLATQEPRDFADPRILTHGKAIFNNSAYKLVLHLDKDPALDVSKLMAINDNELMQIMNYNRAEGLFVCGERRIPIRVLATDKELQEF